MRTKFVKTSNVLTFETALSALKKRGANEACIIVVEGVPGLGKTTSLLRFATQNQAVYLRAKKEWKPTWFMNELLGELKEEPPHSFEKKYGMALKALMQRQALAANSDKTFALIIDEADHISGNARIMETIRDLSDMCELPVILVGMGKIKNNLQRFPQIGSRVSQFVDFKPATQDDVRKFFDELCEVPIADDLVNFTHKVTRGMNREMKEALAIIERFGKRNPPDEGGLTMRDMSGEHLVNDRATSNPITVPVSL
jgi:DNA transposition AAA+ family ATPase